MKWAGWRRVITEECYVGKSESWTHAVGTLNVRPRS